MTGNYWVWSIFFSHNNRGNALPQKNIQKLRTLRHPFVVTYVDSIDLDEASVLVTESCRPLETWLKEYRSRMTDHSPEGHAAVCRTYFDIFFHWRSKPVLAYNNV